ncbi:EVE domain-containing protein [Ramlibacter sp.]|uniref:EVE domain-containing protein n=1 Tax=Ramlibacter sp. TaxID=1917967 RepID=UPI003D0D07DF
MHFLLDTNVLIPLEDSAIPLRDSLANFVRLATANKHVLVYHPASIEDIEEDKNDARRAQTLQRLRQYTKLEHRPPCPWNTPDTKRNDAADNEILYALSLHAASALVTEDRQIHDKAKARGLLDRVFTIQTAEDLLLRLHETVGVRLPNIEEVPLYQLTPLLASKFFDSLRDSYDFDRWFRRKSEEGCRAWVHWEAQDRLGGICIFQRQDNERIADGVTLEGAALKLSTFKVDPACQGRKVGELFLKAAFQFASVNRLQDIFVHGDEERHYFLFEMLADFGFKQVGHHPACGRRDVVYLKHHPVDAPTASVPPFEYLRSYFPHFRHDPSVSAYVVPIRPEYHDILFPDFEGASTQQRHLFQRDNYAGNAIKMAYLCKAQLKAMNPGDVLLFYRSVDEHALTSIGVVETYETLADAEAIVARVKRRTVYSLPEIQKMASKPTRVILFRFVRHLTQALPLQELLARRILGGHPQSITKISHDKFEDILYL